MSDRPTMAAAEQDAAAPITTSVIRFVYCEHVNRDSEATYVELHAEDISIHAFVPDDGTESAAIKVLHRTTRQEVISNDTRSQWHNFRRALLDLLASMNPNPDHIPLPKLMLFDHVRINLPQSVHEGQITRISWDYTRSEWQFFVDCPKSVVSTWYIAADLDWLDQDDDNPSSDD